MPIAIAHSLFGALSFLRRIAEVRVEGETDHDHDRADHLATPDVLPRQEVAERQREDDGGDEQGLDDRDPPAIECGRLKHVAGQERKRSEQSPRLPHKTHERLRVAERDLGKVERTLLLQRCGNREEKCCDEREDVSHGRRLRHTPVVGNIRRAVEPGWATDHLPIAAEHSRDGRSVLAEHRRLELGQRGTQPAHHPDRRAPAQHERPNPVGRCHRIGRDVPSPWRSSVAAIRRSVGSACARSTVASSIASWASTAGCR